MSSWWIGPLIIMKWSSFLGKILCFESNTVGPGLHSPKLLHTRRRVPSLQAWTPSGPGAVGQVWLSLPPAGACSGIQATRTLKTERPWVPTGTLERLWVRVHHSTVPGSPPCPYVPVHPSTPAAQPPTKAVFPVFPLILLGGTTDGFQFIHPRPRLVCKLINMPVSVENKHHKIRTALFI